MPEAISIKDISADTVIAAFYSQWISRFGAPFTVTTDRGSQFESQLFKALTNLLGTKKTRTTAYHPSSNVIIERWHRSLKASVMCHDTTDWTDILPTVLLGLRTSFKEDIKATSAELVYGTTLRLPGEFFVNEDMPPDPQIFVEKFREDMKIVRATLTSHHNKKTSFAHKDLLSSSHVFVRVDSTKKPLQPPYEGSYEVV